MNRESRTTTSLDSILEGDKEEWDVSMSIRIACLKRATCPGCSSCNPRVASDEANGWTTVYKRKPHQVQTNPGSHTLDMNLSRMQNARVRQDEANGYATVYKVNISQMESDAALARLYQEDELARQMIAKTNNEIRAKSDAAVARQLHHEEMRVESDAALARQLRDR